MTYVKRYLKAITWLVLYAYCIQFLGGCANKAPIKIDAPPALVQPKKSDLAVTLIDTKSWTEDPRLCIHGGCVDIDTQDTAFNLVKGGLSSAYNKVDLAPTPNANNPLYAQASVISRKSDLSMEGGLSTTVKINLYRSDKKTNIKRISFTRQTNINPSNNLAVDAMVALGTLTIVLAPFVLQIPQSRAREAVEKAYKQHLLELTEDIKENISSNLVLSINDVDYLPQSPDNKAKITTSITKELKESSVSRVEKCKSDIQWRVGKAAERIACLNKAWNDYTIFVETYVDEFKSFRLNLAKQIDSGKMGLAEYDEQEQKARERLIWHTTLTDEFKNIEATPNFSSTANKNKGEGQNSNLNSKEFIGALSSVLGIAFQVAVIAAPYALGFIAGARYMTPNQAGSVIPKTNCRTNLTPGGSPIVSDIPTGNLICTP